MKVHLTHEGKKITYSINGSGPVVVLLHGFLESGQIWDHFQSILSAEFKVVVIDLPGHGETDVFGVVHTMDFMAGLVDRVLSHQNLNQVVIVGHSMGGYVALAYAAKYSSKLRGLVLFHSHAGADQETAKLNRTRTIQVVENDKAGFIRNFIPDLFAPVNVSRHHQAIDFLKDVAEKTPKEGIVAALRGMKDRADHTETLKSLEVPVLFILGKQDVRIPPETVIPQIIRSSHSELLLLGKAGHMGYIEEREETVVTLRNFCRKIFDK